ncbi:MAG: FliH/SctL family protein [Pirellulaceae bacterium]
MAGIIKSGQMERLMKAGQGRAYELGDVSRLAEEEFVQAKQRAAEIIAEAHRQAERIANEAFQAGQKKAIADAMAEAKEQLDEAMGPLTQAMTGAAEQVEQQRVQWQRDWELQLVDFSCTIAERIIRHELSYRPEIPLGWVREVLDLASGQTSAQLCMHPEDVKALGDQTERIRQSVARGLELEIKADSSLSRGECRLVTRYGELDQCIESQLSRVTEELLGVARNARTSATISSSPSPPSSPQETQPIDDSESRETTE